MPTSRQPRRTFLQSTAALSLAGLAVPHCFSSRAAAQSDSPNARPRVGAIGVGGRGTGIANNARRHGDLVAVCDVDRGHAERASNRLTEGKADIYARYSDLLQREDIDVVTIGTPDHWHTKICLEALQAGKDVYCEKPLTLTIDEGKILRDAVSQSGRVFQVGTQQRSEMGLRFLRAVAMVQAGRIGKVQRATVAIGGSPQGGPFRKTTPPANLDWNMWLGQAPLVEYIPERCHANFRWWYEYSGGKMTDWGAHHVDIAQWAIGMDQTGPTSVEPTMIQHPVEFQDGYPTADNYFNTATKFTVRCQFPNGVEMTIRESAPDLGFGNGVLFEGEEGRFFVNRGKLTGAPVEELQSNPIEEEALVALRKGKPVTSHMENFFLCVQDRSVPVSDVASHHRALTTCHLANIALRLGRPLKWDPQTEQIVDDPEANRWQSRDQRPGFEITRSA